jgi:crotonobetainyl-CoA:carnitine CoA-transferase CaiB-like acyl-CoA transferase
MATKFLKGVRVLDLTNVLAGPYCCYQLALMGSEVIKVERPGSGDLARVLGADPERNAAGMGISFLAQNAGKKIHYIGHETPPRKRAIETTGQERRCLG